MEKKKPKFFRFVGIVDKQNRFYIPFKIMNMLRDYCNDDLYGASIIFSIDEIILMDGRRVVTPQHLNEDNSNQTQ